MSEKGAQTIKQSKRYTHIVGVGKVANFMVWSNKFTALGRTGKREKERERNNGKLVKAVRKLFV